MVNQDSRWFSHVIFRLFGLILSWCILTAQVPYEYFQLQSVTPPQFEEVALKAHLAPQMPDKFYLDANTQKAGDLTLSEPFAPPVGVYKRREVFSQLQWSGENIQIAPDTQACQPYALQKSDDKTKTLHRSALVWLEIEPQAYAILPSDSPEMVISDIHVELEGKDLEGEQPKFRLWRCVDDRYAITVNVGGIYRITYETAALPDSAQPKRAEFFRKASKPSQSLLSEQTDVMVQQLIRSNSRLLKIRHSRTPLSDLIVYFQGFQSQALGAQTSTPLISSQLLKRLLDEEKGLCRHRTFLFMLVALAWGYSVRIAANEIHAFVEIQYKGRWYPIELGGDARSLTVSPTTSTGKSQVQTDFSFLNPSREGTSKDVLDKKSVSTQGNRAQSSSSVSPSVVELNVEGFKFIPEEGFPLRMMRDSRISVSGHMLDDRLNPLKRMKFALELHHSESGRRLSVSGRTDDEGRIGIEFFVPPDWPAGASNIHWRIE